MTDDILRNLLTAIRESCPPPTWSRAVELARSDAVVGESDHDGEVRLRVATDEGLVAPTVTFWLEDEDWWCDCDPDSDEGCVHAAAAIIALRQSRKAGKSLPAGRQPTGSLSYRFRRTAGGLVFERCVVIDGKEHMLTASLAAIASGKAPGPRFIPHEVDLGVERAMGARFTGVVPRHAIPELLRALASCGEVLLDGEQVSIGKPESPVVVTVEDCAQGFRLTAIQDPRITEVFANGAVLCGRELRELGEPGLNAREMEELRSGRVIDARDVSLLITDILPDLRSRVPVDVRSRRLPVVDADILPRLHVDTRRDGNELVVLATIVYGDPLVARLDGDHLTHLGGALPVRRPEMERRLARLLEQDLGLSPGQRARLGAKDGIAMAERLATTSGKEMTIGGGAHRSFFLAGDLMAELGVEGDDLSMAFRTGAGERADAADVLRAWRQGASVVPLIDGGFSSVPVDFLDRHGAILADLLAARDMATGRLPTSALPDLARLCETLKIDGPPGFEKLRALVDGFDTIPEAPLPPDLRATLRPYQRTGANWLAFLRSAGLGALLADDMGLGKTLQALCAIEGRTLVVAPTSVIHNWATEIRRFRPALKCCLYHGPRRELESDADVTLTTYALLRLDVDRLGSVDWGTVVLDEAQAIKNPESQVASAAFRLRARFRIAMTGTPIENRLDELWSQFHAINRGFLGDRDHFQDHVVKPIVDGIPGAAERLRQRIRPFVLRRRKSEVAPELPPRTEVVHRFELEPTERATYESIRAATVPSVVEKLRAGGSVMAALEALLRLRQAACHPGLIPGVQADHSSKVAVLMDMLEKARDGGHKALVFSQWTSMLDRLEPHLRGGQLDFVRLDGSTRDRADVVNQFQSDNGPPVMLVSLKAGGTGLNLTAADHVFLIDPWWNPAVEDQAADRAHRIGQDKPVMVYKLVAKDTVEERIIDLQEHKRAIARVALEGGSAAAAITRDDLLSLLD